MNKSQREAYLEVSQEMFELCESKSQDYSDESIISGGPDNISMLGLPGVFVRMNDKMGRLYKFMWLNKKENVKSEPLEDALKDLANYCIIAIMLLRKKWR